MGDYPFIRLYRVVTHNPSYPGQNGRTYFIEDYNGPEGGPSTWPIQSPYFQTISCVTWRALYCERAYRGCGVACYHVLAIHRGWSVDYVEVKDGDEYKSIVTQ